MTLAANIADGILAWCGVASPTPADATVAQMCADAAIAAINEYRDTDTFETQYTPLAIEMGVYLWQKRGVDGVTAFGENGVQQSYEAGSFPKSMLSRIKLPAKTG